MDGGCFEGFGLVFVVVGEVVGFRGEVVDDEDFVGGEVDGYGVWGEVEVGGEGYFLGRGYDGDGEGGDEGVDVGGLKIVKCERLKIVRDWRLWEVLEIVRGLSKWYWVLVLMVDIRKER